MRKVPLPCAGRDRRSVDTRWNQRALPIARHAARQEGDALDARSDTMSETSRMGAAMSDLASHAFAWATEKETGKFTEQRLLDIKACLSSIASIVGLEWSPELSLPRMHPGDAELLRRVERSLTSSNANPGLLFDVRWRLKHAAGAPKQGE